VTWLAAVAEIDAPADPKILKAVDETLARVTEADAAGGFKVVDFLAALEKA
jgi:hypothetical protein